ncbi:MAG TPA: helix-turn-helix transcriptional regulator [Lacibacter sp.]|nr:helix-turn-helix transcriptional regulator [Lacibacter sp.]HMO88703.1 helix-turn-helix transcriptional regulator [Lacibacter sp.]HMP87466.1 helix-turn-helix transcriptional regulator [Lacibacter sp.]
MPGTLIRKIREQKKVTQEEVARHMGISQNAYSKIENGITQLTINHVKQISEALGVPAVELLRDDFEVHKPLSFQAQSVNREILILALEELRSKLEQKVPEQHEMYPLFLYQLQTAENILLHID